MFTSSALAPLVCIALGLVGCGRAPPPSSGAETPPTANAPVEPSPSDAVAPTASSAPATPSSDAGGDAAAVAGAGETDFVSAKPLAGKSIGHTSVVFKVKLEGGLEAAFKPRSKRGGARYTGEIAAYRLARALGLANVPPAYARTFDAGELRAALGGPAKPAGALFDTEALTEGGRIAGAVIPWLAHFELLAVESPPWRARIRAWLARGAAVDAADRAMAAQISTMILFDYLTANWDRWSGGNVAVDRASSTVLFIDNDGAFFEPPPAAQTAAQLTLARETYRFSRAFVAALRALDDAALAASLGDESPGVPLLTAKQRTAVARRRETLVKLVDDKVKALGEADVLAFD